MSTREGVTNREVKEMTIDLYTIHAMWRVLESKYPNIMHAYDREWKFIADEQLRDIDALVEKLGLELWDEDEEMRSA